MAWVAPFDLGVSQKVQLRTVPTDMEDVFEIWLHLERVSGDVSSWRRVNRRFLNTLAQAVPDLAHPAGGGPGPLSRRREPRTGAAPELTA